MKKRIFSISLAGGILVGGLLNACSTSPADANQPAVEKPFFIEVNAKLSDGRTVLCLYRQEVIGGYSAGMTMTTECDWANAKVIK